MKRMTTKAIVLRGFDYKSFEEEENGETRYELDGYPYLKYLIQLWPGDWAEQMAKMNEAVVMKNRFTMDGGGNQIVHPLIRQELCKCIGCVLSEFTYGKKGHNIWSEIPKYFGRAAPTKL